MTYANQETKVSFRLASDPEFLFTERVRNRAINSLKTDCDTELLQKSRSELGIIAASFILVNQEPHQANFFIREQIRIHDLETVIVENFL